MRGIADNLPFHCQTVTFESVDEILWSDHSNETSLPVLLHGYICFSKFYEMKLDIFVEFCPWPQSAVKGLKEGISRVRSKAPALPSLRTIRYCNSSNYLLSLISSENADAKKCLKNVTETACTFTNETKPVLDLQLGFSDYNPFCDNNRDPGATGKDQCDEVKDLNNPLNNSPDTAGMRIGVLQALSITFLLLFFFV